LVAKTQGHIQRKRTGSTVSHRHLATYAAGDPRIFIRRIAPEIKTDTAVVLLADRSGSTFSVINVIRESLYASALALEAISGVSVAAAAFPSINDGVIPLKHFTQRAPACSHQFARLSADGGTPMAEAMLWAGQQLAAVNKPRKLLLVVTDGAYPESLGAPTVRALASCGINSYAIGVGYSADVPWFPFYKKITDIAELPQAMNDVLMFALKHEGMRQ
jgi:Mg-chelatase subunit ChlD